MQFVEEFLGRSLRRVEVEALFEINASGVGHRDAKWLRLRDERQRFLQLLLRADVRPASAAARPESAPPLLPPTPGRVNQRRRLPARQASTKAMPSRWEFPPAA